MPGLGLDTIQRLDHPLDVGDRGLRLLGRHLQFELRVLVGVGLELVQRLFGLGHVGIDRQGLAFLQQLLVLLQLLLCLLQVGLNLEQVLLLGDGLVEIGDGFVEAGRVGIQRDLQTVFQLGRDLVDLAFGLGEGLLDLVARGQCRLRGGLVRLGFCIQGLVENLFRFPDALDGLIDAILALCDLCVGILGLLGQFDAQRVCLAHQGFGLRIFLLAVGIAGLRFQLGDLRNRLLGLLAGVLTALGFTGLRAGHLRGQVHRLLGQLPRLLELAIGQRLAGLPLVLGDLTLAVFRGLEVGHALTTDVADTFLGRHRELALLLLDAFDLGQMPVGLGVERVDVLPVLGQRLRHRLALGGQDVVFDPLDVGAALFFRLTLAAGRLDPGFRLIVNEF